MPDIDTASGTAASATASRASRGTDTGTNATAGGSPSGIAVEHSSRSCDGALVRAFSFLGKRWNGVILATLFDGAIGFSELRRAVGAISDSVLSDRLSELCAAGLVERRVFVGPPVAVEYRLTPAGEALLPAMKALSAWSRTNLPA
jgi:DNA-binding HxlR family transcriptional regulator